MIDHAALKAAGVARGGKNGVRILGKGELTAKLSFKVAGVSKGAREAIEKAGGSVEVIEVVPAVREGRRQEEQRQEAQGRARRLTPLAAGKADKPEPITI